MIDRKEQIKTWLSNYFDAKEISNLAYIPGDASLRKYLRVSIANNSFIVMDAPPDPSMANFIKIADILTEHNINVPHILQHDIDQGLILMTDLGKNMYLDALKNSVPKAINQLYESAIASLVKMQTLPTDYTQIGYLLESMDHKYIDKCLEVFKTWYINTHKQGKQLGYNEELLTNLRKLFNNNFNAVPQVFVHLDYHSRNLLVTENATGIIDFQDAMHGPITYDLVSLLQDAYISCPRNQVEKWVKFYQQLAIDAGIITQTSTEALLYNFDIIGLQRHIKNLGVFARLHHRDNKSNYLNDIPALLKYIAEVTERYNELAWLKQFITEELPV